MYTFKLQLSRNTIEEIIDFSRLNLELTVELFVIFKTNCFWECYIKIEENKNISSLACLSFKDKMV